MHYWGDKSVDWEGIDSAARYIGERCRRLGRIQVTQYKEKYGTVRVYCYFGEVSLHGLIWPGYICKRPFWPKWAWMLDIYFWPKFFRYTGFSWVLFKWQKWVYRTSYIRAVKRWPHLKQEILCAADWHEWTT